MTSNYRTWHSSYHTEIEVGYRLRASLPDGGPVIRHGSFMLAVKQAQVVVPPALHVTDACLPLALDKKRG